jgi:hypothetical protein
MPKCFIAFMLFAVVFKAGTASAGYDEKKWQRRFAPPQQRMLELAMQDWARAVEQTLPKKFGMSTGIGPLATLRFLVQVDALFTDDKFVPERSQHYIARIKAVSQDDLKAWQTALSAATKDEHMARSLLLLIQQDAVFQADGKVNRTALARHIERLRSLPQDAIKEWAELHKQGLVAAKVNFEDPRVVLPSAAAELINVAAVFDRQDRFQPPAFKNYCEQLRQRKTK